MPLPLDIQINWRSLSTKSGQFRRNMTRRSGGGFALDEPITRLFGPLIFSFFFSD
jgi:hypothetical protein